MRVAIDLESAGVYFLSVEEFEWRPERRDSDGSTVKTNQAVETGSGNNIAEAEQIAPARIAPI